MTVPGNLLTLGQVSVVRGDPALVTAAAEIGLGQLSMPGQKAVLDRPTILSRLAAQGIPAAQVRLTGAEAVTVHRFQRTISTEEFIEMGKAFLRQHPPGPSISATIPTVKPKELVLPGQAADLQVTPRYVRTAARSSIAVQIVVTVDGKECGVREIPFRLKYQGHRVVTVQEIPEGAALSPENIKVETVESDQPEPANWKPPYGLIAVRKLAAATEVRGDMTHTADPPVVVLRNEAVVIRIQRPALVVTAMGVALQEARAGEYIKVRNVDSSRVVLCKVNTDGTVEPLL
ncbi:MAG: flagellar basal body P-ring formation chaperone FlgA [Planctomycetes bacterium]|nr:flagellar basal body P-ring formation chaperone FlgA [Planctomycetota bacterium]